MQSMRSRGRVRQFGDWRCPNPSRQEVVAANSLCGRCGPSICRRKVAHGQPLQRSTVRYCVVACSSRCVRIYRNPHHAAASGPRWRLPKNARPSLSASAVIAEILQIECIELIQTMAALNSDADPATLPPAPAAPWVIQAGTRTSTRSLDLRVLRPGMARLRSIGGWAIR